MIFVLNNDDSNVVQVFGLKKKQSIKYIMKYPTPYTDTFRRGVDESVSFNEVKN